MNTEWDAIIIGAGMSGIGAGIRLAIGGQQVLIVEQHYAPGGLNSFYHRNGIAYDVGLHALTNFVPRGTPHRPLTQLCRQLRIPYEALQLEEQRCSRIQFPQVALAFTNQFEYFLESIRTHFPHEIDGFKRLDAATATIDDTALTGTDFLSTRDRLPQFFKNPLLQEMLLLPLLYYGSAHANDLDWRQFAILYKAIYKEGFARPKGGVRTLLKCLLERYRAHGGELRFRTPVRSILLKDQKVIGIQCASGEILTAKRFFSTIGFHETQALCGHPTTTPPSMLSFAETITLYACSPQTIAPENTIVFFNTTDKAAYQPTAACIDLNSGVICFPEHYGPVGSDPAPTPSASNTAHAICTVRTTHLAGYHAWKKLSHDAYHEQKRLCTEASRACAFRILQQNEPATIVDADMFTPITIERFTGHLNGAIYGSPQKFRDGRIGYENLFLCGTDQGFLGIVGALLSGISMANYHGLR